MLSLGAIHGKAGTGISWDAMFLSTHSWGMSSNIAFICGTAAGRYPVGEGRAVLRGWQPKPSTNCRAAL